MKKPDFLQVDTNELKLKVDFDGNGQAFLKFPKQQVYNVCTISQKRS